MGSSKSKPMEFPEDIMEQLRCSMCKNYLSCGPIQLLPNSTSVCGRCCTAEATYNYRQQTLEVALSRATFPCRYKRYGCDEKQAFGQALHHETDCTYKPFACPSLPFTTCAWQGSVTQVSYHFFQEHPAVTTQFSQFILDIGKAKSEALLIVKDGVSFIIKYKYDGSSSVLHYDVRNFTTSLVEATYKIKLVNNLSPELNVNLKSSKCLAFSPQVSEMQTLTINKFLEVLDNPTALTVQVDISINKITSLAVKARVLINYKLLDTLRCPECQNYLALPIFDCSKGTICADCAEKYTDNCVPSKNAELYKLITEVNYPCRWCNCKFIGKGYYIRIHELVCKYYPYNCPKPGCKTTLTRAKTNSMSFHLGLFHDYIYFSRSTTYLTKTYELRYKPKRFMITFIQNEMVLIKHCKGSENSYIFSLQTFRPAAANKAIAVQIYFAHFHCTLTSKTFVLDNKTNLIVTADKLPKCFNIAKSIVVITI